MNIPPITDRLGQYWDQPNTDEILLDDTCALMKQETFDMLADYSCSRPTGVYAGKMWKTKKPDGWWLMWYGLTEDPAICSVNARRIVLE